MKPAYSHEWFLQKLPQKHKEFYDYSLAKYTGYDSKITVICPKHGPFEISAISHLQGRGCNKCGRERTLKSVLDKKRLSTDEILSRVKEKNPNLSVDLSTYVNTFSKIKATCTKHGDFETTLRGLIYKHHGCPKCARESIDNKRRKSIPEIMQVLTERFGDIYDYSLIGDYTTNKESFTIICKKHGPFQSYMSGDYSSGCPKCANHISKGETEISKQLTEWGIVHETNVRYLIGPQEIDIYIPELNLAIEFNGTIYHSSLFKTDKNYHFKKRLACLEKGVRLITIWDDEWGTTKILEYLKNQLHLNQNKIHGRKCEIREIPWGDAKEFLNQYHLMDCGTPCVENYGLFYNNELVFLTTFKRKSNKKLAELYRCVGKSGTNVIGGFSKIMAYWAKKHPHESCLSYIDLDKFDGNSYFKSGFLPVSVKPSLSYWYKNRHFNRHKFKKSELNRLFPQYSGTAKEICEQIKAYEIWNSGTLTIKFMQKH